MYESHRHAPLPRAAFVRRLLAHGGLARALLLVSLAIGMAGYRGFERLPMADAFLNAAMQLLRGED